MFVATALLAACASPVVPPVGSAGSSVDAGHDPSGADAAATPHDGFHVAVRTDREHHVTGDEVTFTVETCNLGAPTMSEEGGPPFSFTIRDGDGQVVADDGHVISTLELRVVSWAAGECREATGSWDQHFWNRPADAPAEPPEDLGSPNRGEQVPAGQYRVSIGSRYGSASSEPFALEG